MNYGGGPEEDVLRNGQDQGFDMLSEDDLTGGARVAVKKHKGLDKVLLRDFSELPEDVDYRDYGVINVSPSVVPEYYPSFRIFNYNVSKEAVQEALERKEGRRREETFIRPPPHGHRKPDPSKSKEELCKKEKYRNSWRCHFSKDTWHSDPEAPSLKNGLMSPLGYAQVRSSTHFSCLWSFSFVFGGGLTCVAGASHFPNRSHRVSAAVIIRSSQIYFDGTHSDAFFYPPSLPFGLCSTCPVPSYSLMVFLYGALAAG